MVSSAKHLIITHEQVLAFQQLSHDSNPAHVDPAYACSTQFGRPVVYGMCAVLLALGRWADGRSFRLKKIQGLFAKPLFEKEPYDLSIEDAGEEVRVRFRKGQTEQLEFSFSWEAREKSESHRHEPSNFKPRPSAEASACSEKLPHWQGKDFSYHFADEFASKLLPLLGLHPGQILTAQLNALMGSSYFVGMEFPGRQALYSEFEFEFDDAQKSLAAEPFQFRKLSIQRHKRYPRFVTSGQGTGIESFSLVAFERPLPVRYSAEEIEQAVSRSTVLKDKIIFISGATRGFGAVLARLFALQGAQLVLNYRSHRADAEALANDLKRWNSDPYLIGGDVSCTADCRKIRDEISARFGRVDIFVANAWPHISAKKFFEQEPHEFATSLARSVSTFSTPLYYLLPLLPKAGIVAAISSIYTRAPQAQFTNYISAKSAIEGLVRAVALEFPHLRFLLVRPPRMLTDQTNLVYDLNPADSAIKVASRLLNVFKRHESLPNFSEVDL